MFINFILPAMANSGGSNVIYKYAELFTNMGHDVLIYSPRFAYNMHRSNNEIKNVIHQMYCTIKGLYNKRERTPFDKYVPIINERYIRNADATIATSWPTSFDVARLPERCGKKCYFIQGFEVWDNEEYGLKSYQLPLHKIVISTWINEQIKRELGIGPYPVVYNGIDFNRFYRKFS